MLTRATLQRLASVGVCLAAFSLSMSGCSVSTSTDEASTGSAGGKSTIDIDGSSTVYPISQAVAEEFMAKNDDVNVVVGTSGSGGGFDKLSRGEIDISDASRPIKDSEVEECKANGIDPLELTVAIDGLSVVVNPENDWCENITVAQLKQIWEPNSQVKKWSDVDSAWPDEEIRLFGPDTDSGTFDYFTDVICGEEGASRTDYTPSTDDNMLVKGVHGEKYSMGYFGYAYYVENQDKLKALGVAAGDDLSAAVKPTPETIEKGEYAPLSRPLFIYVNKSALERADVKDFVQFYLEEGQRFVEKVGYVKLSQDAVDSTLAALKAASGASAEAIAN